MGARFEDAQRAVGERMDALGIAEGVTTTYADPVALQRAVLSGFVPTEDVEHVLRFVEECGDAMLTLIGRAGSADAMRAGLRSTVAQVLAIGVALERTEGG